MRGSRLYNFGPRRVQQFDLVLDGGGGDGGPSGGFGSGPGQPSPTTPAPTVNPQDISGGLSPQQIDQLATQFRTEEGADLAVAYGEHIVAGTMVAHEYSTGPDQLDYTVALGEGHGGLGKHGAWRGVVKVWHAGEEIDEAFNWTIWFDDAPPAGAVLANNDDGWNWVATDPKPFFGKFAHQSPNRTGLHFHSFQDATELLLPLTGDLISCWIWIDPATPPQEIMLQFRNGVSFEHRAYWGANLINLGTNGTNSRRQISASIPPTGSWQRLDIPVGDVGLAGASVNGIAFLLFDGAATWDQIFRWRTDLVSGAGYLFRPGIISPQVGDVQSAGADSLPTGTATSGTASIFVRLTDLQSAEDRPDKFRGRFRTRCTFDYDSTGEQIGLFDSYSTNPARVAADRILAFFQRIHRDDLTLAQEKFRARIDWPSWVAWRDYCDQLIPWNKDGSGNIFIPRFECHIAFTGAVSAAEALDQICATAATIWQDDGRQIRFVLPNNQIPVHHFNTSNASAPNAAPQDLRDRPNFFVAKFRDLDDEHLGEVTVSVAREDSIRRLGENKSTRAFATMRQSQGKRVLSRQARLEHDNPIFFTFSGDGTALRVLPGDFVTFTHPVPNWDHQLSLVVDVTVRSSEDSADQLEFTAQKIDGPLYSDTDHTPVQEALTV